MAFVLVVLDEALRWSVGKIADSLSSSAWDLARRFGTQLAIIEWPYGFSWGGALGIGLAVLIFNVDPKEWWKQYWGRPAERSISEVIAARLKTLREVQIKLAHQTIENLALTILHHNRSFADQHSIHAFDLAHHCLVEMQNWLVLKLDSALETDGGNPTYAAVVKGLEAYISAYYRLQETLIPIYKSVVEVPQVREATRNFVESDANMIVSILTFAKCTELKGVYNKAWAMGKASTRFVLTST